MKTTKYITSVMIALALLFSEFEEVNATELGIVAFPQVSSYTCWAACVQSVLFWYQKQYTMQDILDFATCGSDQEAGCMGGTCCSNNCIMKCKNDIAIILSRGCPV